MKKCMTMLMVLLGGTLGLDASHRQLPRPDFSRMNNAVASGNMMQPPQIPLPQRPQRERENPEVLQEMGMGFLRALDKLVLPQGKEPKVILPITFNPESVMANVAASNVIIVQQFRDAIARGNRDQVAQLFDTIRLESPDELPYGLYVASLNGHCELVELLLDQGVPAHCEIAQYTAVHAAAFNNHSEIIRLLDERGALIDKKALDGRRPLVWAVLKGHLAAQTMLIDCGAQPFAQSDASFEANTPINGQKVKFVYEMDGSNPLHLIVRAVPCDTQDEDDLFLQTAEEGAYHVTSYDIFASTEQLVENPEFGVHANVVDEEKVSALFYARTNISLPQIRDILIAQLKRLAHEENNGECVVCTSQKDLADLCVNSDCGFVWCKACSDRWKAEAYERFEPQPTCPKCRQPLFS